MKIGIKDLICSLKEIEGCHVSICINHMLYGNQKIKCVFKIYDDCNYIGFTTNNQNICMDKSSIKDILIENNIIHFNNDVMDIKIKF